MYLRFVYKKNVQQTGDTSGLLKRLVRRFLERPSIGDIIVLLLLARLYFYLAGGGNVLLLETFRTLIATL
jgi:hypothetical protein